MKTLPRHGHRDEEILNALKELRQGDVQWRRGRSFSLVYHGGDDVFELCQKAYCAYFAENGLNPSAFPSLRRMEAEVVSMTAHLLGGGEEVVGNMTTGGTESIILAVKAARDWFRENNPKLTRPEMLIPKTAHPAFVKAGRLLQVKPVTVPVDSKEHTVDVRAMSRAINDRTILLVGSAPTYPHGVIDPIPKIARLARKRGLLCHVDAGLGGFVLPFLRNREAYIPPYDFSVNGVSSISVDVHKYGYGPLGSSVLLHKDSDVRRYQYFASTHWPGGIYASPTLSGTRPGGAIAASWAVMHSLGVKGYVDIVAELMSATDTIHQGIASIEGLGVVGHPPLCLLAIESRRHNIYELADHLAGRGWHLERQQSPRSIQLTITRAHVEHINEFLEDLREAAKFSVQEPVERFFDKTKYFLVGAAVRILPKKLVRRVTSMASEKLGLTDIELPTQTASLHGIMSSLPNLGDLEEVAFDALDTLTRSQPDVGFIIEEPEYQDEFDDNEELIDVDKNVQHPPLCREEEEDDDDDDDEEEEEEDDDDDDDVVDDDDEDEEDDDDDEDDDDEYDEYDEQEYDEEDEDYDDDDDDVEEK